MRPLRPLGGSHNYLSIEVEPVATTSIQPDLIGLLYSTFVNLAIIAKFANISSTQKFAVLQYTVDIKLTVREVSVDQTAPNMS